MRRCLSVVLFGCCVSAALGADDRPSDAAIREAITVLKARLAQAGAKEDKDRIAGAIAGLEKLLPDAGKAGGKAGAVNPATLAARFAGKAVLNPKTGELTVVYTFAAKDQLKDFDLGDGKPDLKAGVLRVGPADTFRHAAKFKAVKVTGLFAIDTFGNRDGKGAYTPFLRTSEGAVAGTAALNGYRLGVLHNGKLLGSKTVPYQPGVQNAPAQVAFTVSDRKAGVRYGDAELAGEVEGGAAGHVELHGGLGGVRVKSLVISGTPDEDWLREFLGKK